MRTNHYWSRREGGGGGQERGIQWSPTKCEGGEFLWPKYRILVCKIFYHNVHFTLSLGRWYLKQPFLVWTLTKPSYFVLSRDCYFNKVLCSGELGTTDYHSVYILLNDLFAYRSPLKNSFARVKREKIPNENCVFFFDTEFGAKKIFVFLHGGFSSAWGINCMDLITGWLIEITEWRLEFLHAFSKWVVGRCSSEIKPRFNILT